MSGHEAVSTRADISALRALHTEASELERIEDLLDRFNVFEAIGFVRQEVIHSRFLAFLLNPQKGHGLGALFLERFLRKVWESINGVPVSDAFVKADEGGLDRTAVRTEAYTGDGRIDILLLNELGEWAMIVENKVHSAEHSDQLERYHRFVKKNYPGWRVRGLYLTPYGDAASHEAYTSLSYSTV